MTSELRWCSNCVAMSTRPRITFDERGWCNACRWSEQKRSLDWDARQSQLETLLDRHRSSAAAFDCIVPVSGGKDGSYVAHTLKTRYGMNPLTVTVNPALPLPLGQRNLQAFADSGFTLLAVLFVAQWFFPSTLARYLFALMYLVLVLGVAFGSGDKRRSFLRLLRPGR